MAEYDFVLRLAVDPIPALRIIHVVPGWLVRQLSFVDLQLIHLYEWLNWNKLIGIFIALA